MVAAIVAATAAHLQPVPSVPVQVSYLLIVQAILFHSHYYSLNEVNILNLISVPQMNAVNASAMQVYVQFPVLSL